MGGGAEIVGHGEATWSLPPTQAQLDAAAVAQLVEDGDGGGQTYGLIDGSGNEKPAFAAVAALRL